jgi:hypothetical protein
VKGIRKNETVEVIRVEDNGLMVRNALGEIRALKRKQAKAFDVLERRPIEIAPGDKLLLTANRREQDFRTTNGEIVTVAKLDEKRRIHLADGRVLPSSFKQFAHGYAVTAHRSQGKSVDAVIISGGGMQKELFYVAASRAGKASWSSPLTRNGYANPQGNPRLASPRRNWRDNSGLVCIKECAEVGPWPAN